MSENSWWELFYMNLRDQAQVIRLGDSSHHSTSCQPPKAQI